MKKELKSGILSADKSADGRPTVFLVNVIAVLDLSTPTGMSSTGTYGENCESDNVSIYRVLLVAFLLLWHEN